MSRIFAVERAGYFISEQWTDKSRKFLSGKASQAAFVTAQPYVGTVKGMAQLKNMQRANNTLQDHTWFGLEGCGA